MPSGLPTAPPSASLAEASLPGSDGLQGVVLAAEALAVPRVERVATITALDDVVGEEAIARRMLVASLAMLDRLAPITRIGEDLVAPGTVITRMQLGVGHLGSGLDRAHVDRPERWPGHSQLAHSCSEGWTDSKTRRRKLVGRSPSPPAGLPGAHSGRPNGSGLNGVNRYESRSRSSIRQRVSISRPKSMVETIASRFTGSIDTTQLMSSAKLPTG